jgi:hypothetical protein
MGGIVRPALAGLGLLFAFALPANAATWAPPTGLTPAGVAVDSTPSVAIDDAGFGVAAWSEEDGGRAVVRAATHAPGGAWVIGAAPLSSTTADACDVFAAIDASGTAMVVWAQFGASGCHTGPMSVLFATHGPNDASWSNPGSATPFSQDFAGAPLHASSNASGQMAIGYSTTNDAGQNFIFGAVGSPAGGFAAPQSIRTLPSTDGILDIAAAIGPSGDAGVTWEESNSSNSSVVAAIKAPDSAFTIFTLSSTSAASARLAFDAGGDMIAVYRVFDGASTFFASKFKPAGQAVGQEQTIAGPQTGFTPTNVAVGIDATGTSTAAWVESSTTATSPLVRQIRAATRAGAVGSTWGGNVSIAGPVGSNQNRLDLRVAPSGAALVGWDAVGAEDDAILAYRPAGGAFSTANLGQAESVAPGVPVSLALAPGGDAAAGWSGSADGIGRLSVLDTHAPAISAMTVPATATAGSPVAMSGSVSDLWGLAAGQPAWSFGDGSGGAGAAVTHAFAAPGTYTVTLAATDLGGNAAAPATRTITITAATKPGGGGGGGGGGATLSLAKPKVKASYVAGRLVGSVALRGTSGAASKLTVVIRKKGTKKATSTSKLIVKAGTWSKTVKLPANLLPGTYTVTASGAGVTSASASFTIAAPASGIAGKAYASATHQGPAATRIARTSELWAHFQLAVLPKKGQAVTTQWVLPSGSKLATNARPRTGPIEAQVRDLKGRPLPAGTWRCILRAGGVVIATLRVRIG